MGCIAPPAEGGCAPAHPVSVRVATEGKALVAERQLHTISSCGTSERIHTLASYLIAANLKGRDGDDVDVALVHRHDARESLGAYRLWYLTQRRPYLEAGSWQDYRRHRELRILPHLGDRKLTALTTLELREWLVELSEGGAWAPKTLNDAPEALVVCPNRPAADRLIAANPAVTRRRCRSGTSSAATCSCTRSAPTCRRAPTSTGRRR